MNEPTPDGMGARGSKFWIDSVSTYELRADELHVLEDACRELDLVDEIREQLKDAEFVTMGSQGQDVAHPLLGEIRHHRALFARLVAQLKFPDEEDEGEAEVPTSVKNRAAAEARWRRA